MSSLLGSPAHTAPQPLTEPGRLSEPAALEAAAIERSLAGHWPASRWIGWRLRVLVLAALLGCVAVFMVARTLAALPHVDAVWRIDPQGHVVLVATGSPALQGREGQSLVQLSSRDGEGIDAEPLLLQRSTRWLPDNDRRLQLVDMHGRMSQWLDQGALRLGFADGRWTEVDATPRGVVGLGAMFWLLTGLALAMYLVAMAVLLGQPNAPNAAYAAVTLCQAANIGLIAVGFAFEFALAPAYARWEAPLRTVFDLLTVAAIVQAVVLHPRRLPHAVPIAVAAWLAVLAVAVPTLTAPGWPVWWWTQSVGTVLGLTTVALLGWSHRIEPNPFAVVMRRFAIVLAGVWIALTLTIATTTSQPVLQHHVIAVGPLVFVVFFAAVLMVLPFLSRSQQVLREFSMLAAVSSVATSLDLLFVAVFSLGQFVSLTLSLFVALAAYIGLRQWLLTRVIGGGLTAERTFEQLYRIARDVEAHPEQLPARLSRLLRDLFEPLELLPLQGAARASRVLTDGSTLVVPMPRLAGTAASADSPRALAVRFAKRGRRLFTQDDARFTDRIVEQIERAVAHDRAVEQGRSEERARIAQDLHDDIGARLLTLMYKAPSPEMEDYVRHTLQDLKTLTRGLAASSHPLSHAVAEWKSDIAQRLSAAHCTLDWRSSFEHDIVLSVVQWSALTRVLRELVSNAIAHAQATHVSIEIRLDPAGLALSVADDGVGRNPHEWSHGLGLGGVRKRVKQLGGEVEWRENPLRGISCRVRVPDLATH